MRTTFALRVCAHNGYLGGMSIEALAAADQGALALARRQRLAGRLARAACALSARAMAGPRQSRRHGALLAVPVFRELSEMLTAIEAHFRAGRCKWSNSHVCLCRIAFLLSQLNVHAQGADPSSRRRRRSHGCL
jgi:hypothetical protein